MMMMMILYVSAQITLIRRFFSTTLTPLETRRLRGDLVEVFKIFRGLDDVNLVNKPTDFSLCQILDLQVINLSYISLRLI